MLVPTSMIPLLPGHLLLDPIVSLISFKYESFHRFSNALYQTGILVGFFFPLITPKHGVHS